MSFFFFSLFKLPWKMCRCGVCCKCWGCVRPFNYINSAVLDVFAEAVSVPLKDKRVINIYIFFFFHLPNSLSHGPLTTLLFRCYGSEVCLKCRGNSEYLAGTDKQIVASKIKFSFGLFLLLLEENGWDTFLLKIRHFKPDSSAAVNSCYVMFVIVSVTYSNIFFTGRI